VIDGIFREEITKMYAPDMAKSVIRFLCSRSVLLMDIKPARRNGMHRIPQAMQCDAGRYPSMMCMALTPAGIPRIADKTPVYARIRFCVLEKRMVFIFFSPFFYPLQKGAKKACQHIDRPSGEQGGTARP